MKQILDYVRNSDKLTFIQKDICCGLFSDVISFIADGDEAIIVGEYAKIINFVSDGKLKNEEVFIDISNAKQSLYRPTEGYIINFTYSKYRLCDALFVDIFPNGEVWTHDGYTATLRFNGKDGPPVKDFWGEIEKIKNFTV